MAKIQLLGPVKKIARLAPFLQGDTLSLEPDYLISFGYRKIIREPILSRYAGKIINLHISFLPWNRGANPNFWCWRENTPKGVSMHLIDHDIDTGPLIGQWQFDMDAREHTLQTSYAFLESKVVELFGALWPDFRDERIGSYPQPEGGSLHLERMQLPNSDSLIADWL